jgi:phosphohistidine phosphatase
MPKLFLIRHAIAEDRLLFQKTGLPDNERPLTSPGRNKMKKIAKKLHQIFPNIDVIFQSPLLRSQQTAQILCEFYKKIQLETLNELDPDEGDFDNLLQKIATWSGQNLALVGHEDHLSRLMFFLLTGLTSPPPFLLKKGGIACLEYTQLQKKKFQLLWISTPKIWLD